MIGNLMRGLRARRKTATVTSVAVDLGTLGAPPRECEVVTSAEVEAAGAGAGKAMTMSSPCSLALLMILVAVGVGVGLGAESANSLSVVEASRLLALDAEIVRRLQAYLEEEERRPREEVEGDPESHTHEHPWIPAPLESISRYIHEFDA
ncbi:uncharacterized protein LOC125032809 [Penaeus chinensis]|uniref:uncharacterized protein LOC125032809 n=1 Tax=Penaeus chinensis TaxID=139456 RepID=UPI001FB79FA6|nr:uncharacterized protein LOC125032809 [Penaeus chinensis]